MVQTLMDETRKLPARLRESFVRQWRRSLVKKALAMIKYVETETYVLCVCHWSMLFTIKIIPFFRLVTLAQEKEKDLITSTMNALALYHMLDFTIVLTPGREIKTWYGTICRCSFSEITVKQTPLLSPPHMYIIRFNKK